MVAATTAQATQRHLSKTPRQNDVSTASPVWATKSMPLGPNWRNLGAGVPSWKDGSFMMLRWVGHPSDGERLPSLLDMTNGWRINKCKWNTVWTLKTHRFHQQIRQEGQVYSVDFARIAED